MVSLKINPSNFSEILEDAKNSRGLYELIKNSENSDNITTRAFCRALLFSLGESNNIFPYYIDTSKKAKVKNKNYFPNYIPAKESIFCSKGKLKSLDKPGYVLNIPYATKIELSKELVAAQINDMIQKIMEQSFGTNAKDSQVEVGYHLRAVIGCNCCKSIDKKMNEEFKHFINSFKSTSNLVNLFGFFWEPCWKNSSGVSVSLKEVKTYYRVIKTLLPEKAKFLKKEHEDSVNKTMTVPYCEIREFVKNSGGTQQFIERLRKINLEREVYLALLDPDFKKLRRNKEEGIYSIYNQTIKSHKEKYDAAPCVVSFGYRISRSLSPVLHYGIRLDQLVRKAITTVIPLGIYYPEPTMAVLIEENKNRLDESFCNRGKGRESPNLIKAIFRSKTRGKLSPRKALVFQTQGAIKTTAPERFKPEEYKALGELTSETIYKKNILEKLRIVGQSHANPFSWAPHVMQAFKIRNKRESNAIETGLRIIWNQFDPIHLALSLYGSSDANNKNVFLMTMATYVIYRDMLENCTKHIYNIITRNYEDRNLEKGTVIEYIDIAITKTLNKLKLENNKEKKDEFISLYNHRMILFHRAASSLFSKGLTPDQMLTVMQTARASGQAAYTFLEKFYDPI